MFPGEGVPWGTPPDENYRLNSPKGPILGQEHGKYDGEVEEGRKRGGAHLVEGARPSVIGALWGSPWMLGVPWGPGHASDVG